MWWKVKSTSILRSWTILFVLSLLLVLTGQEVAGREGLLWAIVVALSINSLIYFYGDQPILSFFNAKEVEGRDAWGLSRLTAQLAHKAHINKPRVFLIETQSPHAFSTGRSWQRGRIYVTSGLVQLLTEDELEAVIALQVIHIKQMNTLSFHIGSCIAAALLFVTFTLDRLLRWLTGIKNVKHNDSSFFFTLLMAPVVASTLHLIIGEQLYFNSDQQSAELTGKAESLAQALWKLNSYRKTRPFDAPVFAAHSFTVTPLQDYGWYKWVQIQPTVKRRIKRLIGYYPL